MSPLLVRRYRAERLLREDFEGLREKVLAGVRARLRAAGVALDVDDLEACYAQAWQGLYAAVLDGAQIDSPPAWLTLVTYRRALDEHRSRHAVELYLLAAPSAATDLPRRVSDSVDDRDVADQLHDRARLRQLFEALRMRLSAREQQAATLCYLHGLSRADAARRMGVSEARMRKLMEGRGAGSPGVAAKMGALVQTIRAGDWCEQQGSLMRGLAYGILDPGGERYRLAVSHRDACPACRAYVISLRGLAAVLPPIPALLHCALGAAAGASASGAAGIGAASGPSGVTTGVGAATAAGGGSGSTGACLGGGGALSASGAAGVGAAGGGWWIAGPLGAKLAVGCLLAVSVGAGCIALDGHAPRATAPAHRRHARPGAVARVARRGDTLTGAVSSSGAVQSGRVQADAPARAQPVRPVAAAARVSREFGPEQPAGASAPAASGGARAVSASSTSSSRGSQSGPREPAVEPVVQSASAPAPGRSSAPAVSAAQREFSPG